MDLKTFVSESLKEIVEGVEEAQEKCHNAVVSPSWGSVPRDKTMRTIEFDIAVTVEKEKGTKGGLAVLGCVVNLGTQGQSSASDTVVSRIKFSVPVIFQLKGSDPKIT